MNNVKSASESVTEVAGLLPAMKRWGNDCQCLKERGAGISPLQYLEKGRKDRQSACCCWWGLLAPVLSHNPNRVSPSPSVGNIISFTLVKGAGPDLPSILIKQIQYSTLPDYRKHTGKAVRQQHTAENYWLKGLFTPHTLPYLLYYKRRKFWTLHSETRMQFRVAKISVLMVSLLSRVVWVLWESVIYLLLQIYYVFEFNNYTSISEPQACV